MVAHHHHENQPHHPMDDKGHDERSLEEKKAHTHLWIAVGVTMFFILAFWALLLPGQFSSKNLIGEGEIERWEEVKDGVDDTEFQESMIEVQKTLDEMSAQLEEEAEQKALEEELQIPEETIEDDLAKLKEKVEESSTTQEQE